MTLLYCRYGDMCDRAQQLQLAIKMAENEELEVRLVLYCNVLYCTILYCTVGEAGEHLPG